MGVASNRVDVRQAAARAERALERLAEPLSALFLPRGRWPAALLDEAWRGVIRNAAHDSVCACSIDEVCDAVLHRYAEASDIGHGLADRAAAHLLSRVEAARSGGVVVVNPSARDRAGLVEVRLPGGAAPPGTQLVRSHPADRVAAEGPAAEVLPAVEHIGWSSSLDGFTLETADGTPLVAHRRQGRDQLVTPEVRAALDALDPEGTGELRLVVHRPGAVTVLARVDHVPGFGWSTWTPGAAGPDITRSPGPAPVALDGTALDNGLVRVEVDPGDGTFSLDGHRGLGRLVDGGDCGDTYNWCPPAHDTVVDRPDEVTVEALESGPLRGRLAVTARYRWPAACQGLDRRVGEVAHEVRTVVELRAGEAAARVAVTVDNRSRDHRLRAHLPLPRPAEVSRAECAFATVERGLVAEGGPTEAPLATYPSRRFVQAGGLTVVHDGLPEYELVDLHDGQAGTLALTLLRCTGMLSQGPMSTRPLPAGPLTRMEGPQLQRPLTFRYAVAVGDVDPYALADDVLVPLVVARDVGASRGAVTGPAAVTGDPDLPASGSALTVGGAEVSAVVRDGGALVVRVFNPRPEPTTVTVEGRTGWLVDLRGRPLEPFEGSFTLRSWGLATATLAG
jgi:hypothetical protein